MYSPPATFNLPVRLSNQTFTETDWQIPRKG